MKHLSVPFENIRVLPFETIIITLSKALGSSKELQKHCFETFNYYSCRNHLGLEFNITKVHKRTEAKALISKAFVLSKRKWMVSKPTFSKSLRRWFQSKKTRAPFRNHCFKAIKISGLN